MVMKRVNRLASESFGVSFRISKRLEMFCAIVFFGLWLNENKSRYENERVNLAVHCLAQLQQVQGALNYFSVLLILILEKFSQIPQPFCSV